MFLSCLNRFKGFIKKNGLDDVKPYLLVFDGHASHVNIEVTELVMSLNIQLFHFPSQSSHVAKPLDVTRFRIFKKAVTSTLTKFPSENAGKMPVNADMTKVIKKTWAPCFTPHQAEAFWEGDGL